jgi:hypothetical protein
LLIERSRHARTVGARGTGQQLALGAASYLSLGTGSLGPGSAAPSRSAMRTGSASNSASIFFNDVGAGT